jgi:hypothetical protein
MSARKLVNAQRNHRAEDTSQGDSTKETDNSAHRKSGAETVRNSYINHLVEMGSCVQDVAKISGCGLNHACNLAKMHSRYHPKG